MNMQAKENENLYKTADLSLAAALSLYYPILDLEPLSSKKTLFVFSDSKDLQSLITSYWSGSLLVDAKSFSHSLKSIKSRLYGDLWQN